jgi:protein TonB
MSAVLYPLHGGSPDNRVFHYAIVLSIVLHALLLFAVPGLREGKRAPEVPGVLVAHIVQPQSAAAQTPPQNEPIVPRVEPPKPRVEPLPEPPPIRRPNPVAQPAPPPPPAPEPVPPSAAPPAASASAPGPASTEPQPSASAAGAAELGTLSEYERAIRIVATRYKTYPRVAMDNNWEGTVEVSMVVGANGVISSISVKTSSGYRMLDQEAIEMFKRAKPLVPIPPALRGKEFTVVLRAIYSLKEPQG